MSGRIDDLVRAAVPFDDWERDYVAAGGKVPSATADVVVEGDFRPILEAPGGGGDPREFAGELGRVMGEKGLYSRAGGVWFHDVRAGALQPMSAVRFPFWMLEHVKLMTETVRQGSQLCVMSADMAARVLLAPPFMNALPEIARVSPVPLPVLRDGRPVLLSAGYSAAERTMVLGDVAWEEMDRERAVEVLLGKWLGEFPFDARSEEARVRSQAVAVAAMLAPFCELLVPAFQQRPAFCFTANREGSGKTLLARLALCPVYGKAKMTPPPEKGNENSLRQLLSSVARSAEPYVFFDNWRGKIGSPSLEAFITANIWGDRVLGVSELFTAEKSCLVYLTGNDAFVTPDMRRRSLFVELFQEDVRSESRVLKRQIDEDDIIAERGEILSALWAIVRGWYDAGCPKGSVEHGSFAKWGRVVGAMVEWAVGVSPLAVADLRKGDADLAAFEELIDGLKKQWDAGSAKMSVPPGVLLEAALDVEGFGFEEIPEEDGDKAGRAKVLREIRGRFGRICKRFVGSRFGDVRFGQSEHASRDKRVYELTRV